MVRRLQLNDRVAWLGIEKQLRKRLIFKQQGPKGHQGGMLPASMEVGAILSMN